MAFPWWADSGPRLNAGLVHATFKLYKNHKDMLGRRSKVCFHIKQNCIEVSDIPDIVALVLVTDCTC